MTNAPKSKKVKITQSNLKVSSPAILNLEIWKKEAEKEIERLSNLKMIQRTSLKTSAKLLFLSLNKMKFLL